MPPPDGRLRSSQAVTTFGPGAMLDLLGDAVLVAGLDFWKFASGAEVVPEPRLRDDLAERMRAAGRPLDVQRAFLAPPAGDEQNAHRGSGVPVLEFPTWFVCQDRECRALIRAVALQRDSRGYFHIGDDAERSKHPMVPVRFVGACRQGHIEDFPWKFFVHERAQTQCAAPRYRLLEGATGDFAEVEIRCVCGAQRRLIEAAVEASNPRCQGERPWLGADAKEECQNKLRLLVRSASNTYFPQVVSAISIPEDTRLQDAVQTHWSVLSAATAATLPAFRTIPTVRAALLGFSDAEVMDAVTHRVEGRGVPRAPLRTAEYLQLTASPPEGAGELPPRESDFFARTFAPESGLPPGIERIVLLHKLREVRVQV